MTTTTTPSGVKKTTTISPITLDKVGISGEFQKPGTKTAQVRQQVKTVTSYPSKKTSSDMQSGLFKAEDFGFETQNFENIENRVAFPLVPINATEEQIKANIAAANTAGGCIYRVLSNEPILDDNQKYAVSAGLRTKEQFANTQVVRYPDNERTQADGTAGKIWTDAQGKVQYRKTFFWDLPKEDVDLRNGKSSYFTTSEIQAELEGASVLQGQTLVP